ncbi:MAG: HDIG domain-containing protein [Bacteroidetes bacterium]|nr:HDIG domain-containing protein [Bacteroidota bacterium]
MKKILSFFRDRHADLYKVFLVLISISFIVYLFPKEGKFKYEFQKGKPWLHEDLIAPFDFAINKLPEEVAAEQNEIIKNFKPYFKLDSSVFPQIVTDYPTEFEQRWSKLKNPKTSQRVNYTAGTELLNEIYQNGVIKLNDLIEHKPGDFSIFVLENNLANEVELKNLFSIQSAYNYAQKSLEKRNDVDRELILSLLEDLLKQNIFYDQKTSLKVKKDLFDNISLIRDMNQRGQRIISRGDMVDNEKFNILNSLKAEYLSQLGANSNFYFILSGQFILVGICLLMLFIFFYLFRKDIFEDNHRMTFIMLMVCLMVLMASLATRFSIFSIYLLPFCILPVMARTFFDTRVAMFTHLATCLIIGLHAPNPFEFVFIQLIGGIFAIFSIINLRKRAQLFFSVVIIFMAYTLSYVGISVIQEGKFTSIDWTIIAWFGASAGLTLFSYPLIYLFEKLFGFISDVSLMELADINSPLLRELALRAPGTFQHSLQVANLAEEAILAVGGSSLLVRTGALYHDIGKMEMPMYFIENQYTGVNPHDELSFEDSAKIITGHVHKGIEIAKKNNLPDALIDFIRTHHGTTKAQYFYVSFLKNFPGQEVDESIFQYPGPIPFSKETAVLMMADSVEAASRSLKKYDAEIIGELVEKVIDRQIEQQQFLNADITFKNINSIKKIFKKKLLNIHHLRIEYPK